MIKRSGRNTVPQIYIDEQYIGGYDDLTVYFRNLKQVDYEYYPINTGGSGSA